MVAGPAFTASRPAPGANPPLPTTYPARCRGSSYSARRMGSIFRAGLFDGGVAIITGGGSGIGLAIASALGELGAKVAIGGRDLQRLARAKTELEGKGVTVHAAPCDIRDVEQVATFVA